MKTTKAGFSILAAIVCISTPARAQKVDTLDLSAVGRDSRWQVDGRTTTVVDVKGKHALKVGEGAGMGVVWLDGYDFANGEVEVDIMGRSQPVQGSFVGVVFHLSDARNNSVVYFRPFNFRAADSTRRGHSVQYASHPDWPWQRLRSERPGVFEQAVVPEPDGDEWFHVRIVFERPKISVFVNDQPAPCLVVDELGDRTHGSLGLWVGEGSGGYFANLRVKKSTDQGHPR